MTTFYRSQTKLREGNVLRETSCQDVGCFILLLFDKAMNRFKFQENGIQFTDENLNFNIFTMSLFSIAALLAFEGWLLGRHGRFIFFWAAAIIVFRAELAILMGLILLLQLFTRKLSLWTLIKYAVPSAIIWLGEYNTSVDKQ